MPSDRQVIAGEWTLLSLALVLVSTRLYVRVFLLKDRLHLADIWLLFAAACGIALVICDTLVYKNGEMDEFDNPGVYTMKVRFTQGYWFDVGMYFPKFSIVSFYYKLVPPTKPHMRKVLYALIALTVSCSIVTFLDITFWCRADVQSNWSEDPDACNAYNSMTVMRIHWAMNFTTEVLNVLFPFPLLKDLKLRKKREKVGLGVIFGLGLITISVSIGRFINMNTNGNNFSAYLWASSELYVSIMVVSLTALRPLLKKFAHLVHPTLNDIGYQDSCQNTSGGVCMEAGESKPTHLRRPGMDWRTSSDPDHMDRNAETGSQVELNAEREGDYVVKVEEIQISAEASTAGDSQKSVG